MMLFKKTKKTLAALLCLCMVAAVIPAGIPGAAATDTLVGDFSALANWYDAAEKITFESTNGAFDFFGKSAEFNVYTYQAGSAIDAQFTDAGQWYAIETASLDAGLYDVSITPCYYKNNGGINVYFIPKKDTITDADLTEDALIASYNGYSASASTIAPSATPVVGKAKVEDAGNYLVVFQCSSMNASYATTSAYLSRLEIAPTTIVGTVLTYQICSLSSTLHNTSIVGYAGSNWAHLANSEFVNSYNTSICYTKYNKVYGLEASGLEKGEYVAFELKDAKAGCYDLSAYHEQYLSGGEVDVYVVPKTDDWASTYKSFNNYVGMYDCYSTGDAHTTSVVGKVTLPADGSYVLVLVNRGVDHGYNRRAMWLNTLTFNPVADGLYAALEKNVLTEGESAVLKATVVEGGAVSSNVNVTVAKPTVASYANGKITALKPGTTDITVSYGSSSKTFTLTVEGVDLSITLDVTEAGIGHFQSVETMVANDVWGYVGCKGILYGSNENTPYYSNADKYIDFRYMSNGSYVVFEIKNVEAGDYNVNFDYKTAKGGGIAEVYLVPKTGEFDVSMCTPATSVGKVSFYKKSDALEAASKAMKNITVPEKSNYYLVVMGTGRAQMGATTVGGYWTGLRLEYVGEPTTPVAGDAMFGKKYAYVRKNFTGEDNSYEVTLIGGIKVDDIADYKAVGFKINAETLGVAESVSDNAIFESITLADDSTLTAADFGADYIFVSKYTFATKAALEFMNFQAFAVEADSDNEVYGDEFIVTIGK